MTGIEAWMRHHRRQMVLALIGLSLLVRAGYYAELSRGPSIAAHRWTESDMNFFDRWAHEIVAGDWLTNQELHPVCQWNRDIARIYFREHPEKIAEYLPAGSAAGDDNALSTALWNRWYGGKTFHQEPLYAYAIALTYQMFGQLNDNDVRWVFAWQMMLGVLTNLLVYEIARRTFGELAGAIAGLLVVFYSPLFFYELTLLRTTLLVFLSMALVFLVERTLQRQPLPHGRGSAEGLSEPRPSGSGGPVYFLTGILFGLAILCQTSMALFFFGCLGFLAWQYRQLAAAAPLWVALGAALAVSPAVLRNLAVGAPPLSLVGNGAEVFALGNDVSADPDRGPVLDVPRMAHILDVTGAKMLPVAIMSIRSHGTIGSYARLLWKKFAKFWHWYEEPDNQNFYYCQLHSRVLRWAPFTNYLLAPFMLLGLLIAWRDFRRCAPLYILISSGMLLMLVVPAIARYRVQYLAAMIPLAAASLVHMLECIRLRQYPRLAGLMAALMVVFLWTSRPLPASRPAIRATDYIAPYFYYWAPLHNSAVDMADARRAAQIYSDSLRSEPQSVRDDAVLARWYAQVHAALAQDFLNSGDQANAQQQSQRAEELRQAAAARR
jgi:4-amino-4-deoxy-L-arabinose transferase-like glycosyltransferase